MLSQKAVGGSHAINAMIPAKGNGSLGQFVLFCRWPRHGKQFCVVLGNVATSKRRAAEGLSWSVVMLPQTPGPPPPSPVLTHGLHLAGLLEVVRR